MRHDVVYQYVNIKYEHLGDSQRVQLTMRHDLWRIMVRYET